MLLIANKIQTPDGTVLHSKHRHDYVEHRDKNGKLYMLDGGMSYVRRSANGDELDISVDDQQPHEVIREEMLWGSYGKSGEDELRYIKLKDMCIDHINSCLNTQTRMLPQFRAAMLNEIDYREERSEMQLWQDLMDSV